MLHQRTIVEAYMDFILESSDIRKRILSELIDWVDDNADDITMDIDNLKTKIEGYVNGSIEDMMPGLASLSKNFSPKLYYDTKLGEVLQMLQIEKESNNG